MPELSQVKAQGEHVLLAHLQAQGHLDVVSGDRALRAQKEAGGRLSSILINLGLCGEEAVISAIEAVSGVSCLAASDFPETLLPDFEGHQAFLRAAGLVPISVTEDILTVAMCDVLDDEPVRALEFMLGKTIDVRLALPSDIERTLDHYFQVDSADSLQDGYNVSDLTDLERLKDMASEAPVVQRLNNILSNAIKKGVSDVHIEAVQAGAQVRYRIDGIMQTEPFLTTGLRDAVMTRLKVIAGLDLAERRLPQDGRAQVTEGGRSVDLRVATMPTLHGESAVIRILDRETALRGLEELGFSENAARQLRSWLSQPQGLICVTGPTGSGKTTTLYAALMEFDAQDKKIMSVEDPVEYQLEGVNQVQVNAEIGFTFARALRGLLRHNPNIIMLGEIRDSETAEIAVQAAQTGHLVLATLHTNDAVSAVVRLVDMGVEPYLASATLTGIAAQRLVRSVCQTCRGARCGVCGQTGMHGRTALLELLNVDDAFRAAIMQLKNGVDLYEPARLAGWVPLKEHGAEAVAKGLTTEEEVLRATLALEL